MILHGLLFSINADWLGGELVTVNERKALSMTMTYRYPPKPLPKPVAPVVPKKSVQIKKKKNIIKPEIPVKTVVPQASPLPSKEETMLEDTPVSSFDEVPDLEFPAESDMLILNDAPEGYESEPQESPVKMEQTGINTLRRIVSPRAYEDNMRPQYPRMARRRGYEGVVTLKVLVSREGEVLEVRVLKTSGYSILDEEAKRTVIKYRFEPGSQNGEKIDMWGSIPIRFQLK